MRVYNEQLVKAPYPFGFIGEGLTHCAVLALPSWQVCRVLPANLALGEQDFTPKGMHPVILLFHQFFDCQFSFPTFLPPMKFNEQTIGIPFTGIPVSNQIPGPPGPYYYMPKLYLDDPWVWMIGRNYWGFDKEMAAIYIGENSYTVASNAGRQLVSLAWSGSGVEPRPAVDRFPGFEPVRQMLTQPLISVSPAALGPLFALTDFDRSWNLGTIRPIPAVLDIDPVYLPSFEGGRYSTSEDSSEARPRLLGAYELSAQWWLSFPYLPPCSMP
jgi:hypothetical protein